jgi:hypothetical protein
MTHGELNRAAGRNRQWLDEAIDQALAAGQIHVEDIPGSGNPGRHYRVTS